MKAITAIACAALFAAGAAAHPEHEGTEPPEVTGLFIIGGFTATMMEDGHYVIVENEDNAAFVIGQFTANDGTMTVRDIAGPHACGSDQTGEYSYEMSEAGLVLTLVSDPCEDRAGAATSAPWTSATSE